MMGWPGCWGVQQESALSAALALVIVAQLYCVFGLSLPPINAVSHTELAAGGTRDTGHQILQFKATDVSP
jgi:hypothetical protein